MDEPNETADFWQDHSLTFLEMAFRNDRRERLEQPDGHAKKPGIAATRSSFLSSCGGIPFRTWAMISTAA